MSISPQQAWAYASFHAPVLFSANTMNIFHQWTR